MRTMNSIVVQKYGGSSVADPARLIPEVDRAEWMSLDDARGIAMRKTLP